MLNISQEIRHKNITMDGLDRLDKMIIRDQQLDEIRVEKRRRSNMTVHKIPTSEEDKVRNTKTVGFDVDGNGSCDNDSEESHNAGSLPLCKQLTPEMCVELWYQPSEIAAMKQNARYALLHRNEASEDDLAGLERFNSQRAVWKRSAIQYVLMAQKQHRGEDFLRRVSLRCTGWARETAMKQGFKDYCAVHDPLASLFEGDEENYNDCFFSEKACCNTNTNSNKRKTMDDVSGDETGGELMDACPSTPDDGRRVRQKIAAQAIEDDIEDDFSPIPVF